MGEIETYLAYLGIMLAAMPISPRPLAGHWSLDKRSRSLRRLCLAVPALLVTLFAKCLFDFCHPSALVLLIICNHVVVSLPHCHTKAPSLLDLSVGAMYTEHAAGREQLCWVQVPSILE